MAAAKSLAHHRDMVLAMLEQLGVPADVAARTAPRVLQILSEYLVEMDKRRPRHSGITVPLDAEQRAKLQACYEAYGRAAIESLILAVIAAELGPIQAAGGTH